MARQRIKCHKKAGVFLKHNLDVEFYFIDWESVDKYNKWHSRANKLKIYLIASEIFKDKRETKPSLWFLKYQIAKKILSISLNFTSFWSKGLIYLSYPND